MIVICANELQSGKSTCRRPFFFLLDNRLIFYRICGGFKMNVYQTPVARRVDVCDNGVYKQS